jgi:hypothetical protein
MCSGSTAYVLSRNIVPLSDRLPWRDEECDAVVAILEPEFLTDTLADELASSLVALNTDWVETLGKNAESLHDLIDRRSVVLGRQNEVGEGNPMTGWHEELGTSEEMADFIRLGGLGLTENKLVIVVGSERGAARFITKLKSVLLQANRLDAS